MWVRPSTASYGSFSLGTGRSPGFGLAAADWGTGSPVPRPLKARFPCGSALEALNLARSGSSPDRSTKSTRSHTCTDVHLLCSHSLWTQGFRFSFTPLPGSFSPFPHGTVLYRSLGSIQPYGVVPARSRRVSRVPRYSGSRRAFPGFTYGAFTLYGRSFQFRSVTLPGSLVRSEPRSARTPVWAPPVSLAATPGITFVFFSSGYLDVSVRRVPLRALWIHARMHKVSLCGFPHSDTRGSMGMCPSPRLFAAYRVFHRLPVPRHPPCAFLCLTSCTARRLGFLLRGCLPFRAWRGTTRRLLFHYHYYCFI